MVGLVAQCVAEHLSDTWEFILASEGKHHAEESVELSAFHTLTEEEHIMGEGLLVFEFGKVELPAESAGIVDDEGSLLGDGWNIFEHRFTLVRINSE